MLMLWNGAQPLMGKEGHCSVNLRTTDASFAESLYGLRRRAVNIKVKTKDNLDSEKKILPLDSPANAIHHNGLEKRQKVLSIVFLDCLLLISFCIY
ncbi:peroxisome biogenesis protein 12-like [Coffea arabica]|uniref:Peroxisome biogenesis protein 12-like n=1 Tax=Coffea arabica TaxID=13443 RepID=A0ABM4VFG1_COFAR